METSATASPEPEASSRRRSGRVTRAPKKFAPEPATEPVAAKRKRGQKDDETIENEELESADDASEDSQPETDGEQSAPRSRKQPQKNRAARKKPKTNGAMNHVAALPSRPKKGTRIDAGDRSSGLFGKKPSLCDSPALTQANRETSRDIRFGRRLR